MSFNKLMGYLMIIAPLLTIVSMPPTNLGQLGVFAVAVVAAGLIIAGIEVLDND